MNPPPNITEYQIGGRLIPRSLVESNVSALIDALEFINNHGATISGVSINVNMTPSSPNSINNVWRTTLFDAVFGL